MANLLSSMDSSSNAPELMVGNGKSDTYLLVVATADRGLCGAFNSNIVKLATQEINELIKQGKQVKIICIGKKGYDLIRRSHEEKIIDFISLKEVKSIAYSDAEGIGNNIVARFEQGEFDICLSLIHI